LKYRRIAHLVDREIYTCFTGRRK